MLIACAFADACVARSVVDQVSQFQEFLASKPAGAEWSSDDTYVFLGLVGRRAAGITRNLTQALCRMDRYQRCGTCIAFHGSNTTLNSVPGQFVCLGARYLRWSLSLPLIAIRPDQHHSARLPADTHEPIIRSGKRVTVSAEVLDSYEHITD